MRIAHVITRMIVGGAQENTLLSCRLSAELFGDEVLLVSGPSLGPEGDLMADGRAGGLAHRIIPSLHRSIHPWRDWRSYRQLMAVLREFQPDVVHTHSAKGGILGRLAASKLRVPAIVHTIHGAPFHPFQSKWARRFGRSAERFAARRCHRLVSVADAMTDQMVAAGIAPREQFTTIYSGMDTSPYMNADQYRQTARRELGFNAEHVIVGKIARLFHLKGHTYVIEAASRVVERHPNVRFLVVGDGILRGDLEMRIRKAGLADYFHLAGLVPPSRIPELIAAMDILVHASLREGLARALPQALIAGKPVVSFDVDGAREVVVDDETGYLVSPRDSLGLADAVDRLASDAALRSRLGTTGRLRCEEPFRAETMVRRLHKVYRELLDA